MDIPQLGTPLNNQQLELLNAIATNCRYTIIKMLINSQSGHPGGSLSTIDYLTILYTFIINQNNAPVVVSNGHISPAVYSILAELNVVDKKRVIENFRKANDVFEGHINREVDGIWYGTGPLAIGGSVATGFAHAQKLENSANNNSEKVYLIMGDGENQEGQAYEMMNYANKYKLNNLILFIDYNRVQLTASLDEVMPTNLKGHYEASGWEIIEVDGHNFNEMWEALNRAHQATKPVCIIGHTIMGKGISFMEATGKNDEATWHGKAPSPEQGTESLNEVTITEAQKQIIADFLSQNSSKIQTTHPGSSLKTNNINSGTPILYTSDTSTDCRSAYGAALKDLATLNPDVLAITADLEESVKTAGVKAVDPNRHIDVGIAEQHMVSLAGGLSLMGKVPFCSTFGAFMSSRAKDQARVNDINQTNVKMVATHCGLSVGEDGPTHQAIDDISSFLGFFHTEIIEPIDPNQTDRIIRYIAKTYGNFYVRMGRAKTPVIKKADGTPFYDENYEFKPGQADIIETGDKVTIVACGPMLAYAQKAIQELNLSGQIELIAVSSFRTLDTKTLATSLQKTGKLITIQDHNVNTGIGMLIDRLLAESGILAKRLHLGVKNYQLSGTADELYEKAGLGVNAIKEAISKFNWFIDKNKKTH